MELFAIIDFAHAIIREPKGIQKQVKLYRRGTRVFVPKSGGYVEVRGKQPDGSYLTAHPDVKLLELDCDVVTHERVAGQDMLRFEPQLVSKAA